MPCSPALSGPSFTPPLAAANFRLPFSASKRESDRNLGWQTCQDAGEGFPLVRFFFSDSGSVQTGQDGKKRERGHYEGGLVSVR